MTRALLVLGLLFSACATEAKSQSRSLLAAVERFQKGENEARPALALDVAHVPCTASEVTPACAACVKATGSMGRAIALKTEVERSLDAFDAGRATRPDTEALQLDKKLTEAMRLLDEARAAMPECETRLNELRRAHGL